MIKNWRRILSQFHEEEFEYDSYHFKTAEHAWHYVKLCTINQHEKAYQFTLESQSRLALGNALEAKKAGGRRGIHTMTSEEIREWEQKKVQSVEKMLLAKFNSSDLAKQVLMATGDAQVLHYERGPKYTDLLSRVRMMIREKKEESV